MLPWFSGFGVTTHTHTHTRARAHTHTNNVLAERVQSGLSDDLGHEKALLQNLKHCYMDIFELGFTSMPKLDDCSAVQER
jgi:2-oxo-4-hydroxy-4-carboxy--5-ureidoimidazoline (OHCU) decarboxylase